MTLHHMIPVTWSLCLDCATGDIPDYDLWVHPSVFDTESALAHSINRHTEITGHTTFTTWKSTMPEDHYEDITLNLYGYSDQSSPWIDQPTPWLDGTQAPNPNEWR